MVDGAIVLVDAAEGPMPQTKFVVGKALKVGLKPIVVINKIDRPDARFTSRSSTRCSTCSPRSTPPTSSSTSRSSTAPAATAGSPPDPEGPKDHGLAPLFDLIVKHVPAPTVHPGPFRMIGTLLEANPFLGRIITGRIESGTLKPNQASQGPRQ